MNCLEVVTTIVKFCAVGFFFLLSNSIGSNNFDVQIAFAGLLSTGVRAFRFIDEYVAAPPVGWAGLGTHHPQRTNPSNKRGRWVQVPLVSGTAGQSDAGNRALNFNRGLSSTPTWRQAGSSVLSIEEIMSLAVLLRWTRW